MRSCADGAPVTHGARCLWECAMPRRDGMVCPRVTTSSAAHTVQCAGLRDAGEVSEASPRHGRAGTSLSRAVPATAPAVRCQSAEGEEGQRSPAAMRPGRRSVHIGRGGTTVACRHAPRTTPSAAIPPLMLVCMRIVRTRAVSGARAAKGTQVHRYSECAPRRRRSSPRKHALSPVLRATPAGRAHPSVRSRSGG